MQVAVYLAVNLSVYPLQILKVHSLSTLTFSWILSQVTKVFAFTVGRFTFCL
jgi:hypothetical protein